MIEVRIKDNRFHNGYNIVFFHTDKVDGADVITEEIIDFVRKKPKAYWLHGVGVYCYNRKEVLKAVAAAEQKLKMQKG